MSLRDTGRFASATLALVGALWFNPALAQDENPTTPGAIPDPSTYQGSTELQRQSDQQDQQYRQQQQQPSYSGQPRQGGYASSRSSGGQSSYVDCFSHVARLRSLAPIAGKVTLGPADPGAVELFGIQSKPTATERVLIAKWKNVRRYCYSLYLDDPISQRPVGRYTDSRWGPLATDRLITQLIDGQLTFGQFNYRRAMNQRAMTRYADQLQRYANQFQHR